MNMIQRERVVVEMVVVESKWCVGYYGALWGMKITKWVKNIKENLRDVELVSVTQTPSNRL
jgi:hypothetical protein